MHIHTRTRRPSSFTPHLYSTGPRSRSTTRRCPRMARKSDNELLAPLREIDTPTITNVVATYPTNPLCLGLYNPWTENWYTDTSIRCIYPELGPIVGYAV